MIFYVMLNKMIFQQDYDSMNYMQKNVDMWQCIVAVKNNKNPLYSYDYFDKGNKPYIYMYVMCGSYPLLSQNSYVQYYYKISK